MQYRNAWTINFYQGENLLYVTSDAFKTNEYTFPLRYDYIQFFKFLMRFSSGKQT